MKIKITQFPNGFRLNNEFSGHDEIMGSINYVERSAMKLCFLILIDKFTFKKAMFCFPLSNIYLIMILWTEFGTK